MNPKLTFIQAAFVVVVACAAALGGEESEDPETVLAVGDAAPSFELLGSDGTTYRLEELSDRQAVVVAWYPKAFTGG